MQEKLFNEITNKIKQEDISVPYLKKGYYYYSRYEEKKEYPVFCRKKDSLENPEEILLDVNELAENYNYYDVKGLSISQNGKHLAYGVDTIGRRNYNIFIKNLENGTISETGINETTGNITWANDNCTVFYSRKDKQTLRSYRIFRKKINDASTQEILVYEEIDDTYNVQVYKTKSEKYIIIGSHSTLSDEYQLLNANNPEADPEIFHKREKNLEYSISHIKDKFYIKTNYMAENFRVMETKDSKTSKEFWKEVIPHRKDVLIEALNIFNDYLVISERINAQQKLRVIGFNNSTDYHIQFDEEVYTAFVSINPEFNTSLLRIGYFSPTTPTSIYDYNMETKSFTLLKQQEVVGDFKPSDYISKRIFVKSDDGEDIPMSMVYHKNTKPKNQNPLLLYGYGSYGHIIDPYFSIPRLSLLDRGFIFVIAHIRGSEIKGRYWYKNGKLLKKKNTFYDFIACAKYLISNNYTTENKLYAMGGSAGGLLMGAVVNMAPHLFNGIIAAVPFVDVINTMLDDTIPLTTGEYDEWGNPNIKEYYEYILSYSPYDNVEKKDYPAMMITTGLHDSQVQYWEPAKWVAKLREYKTDNNILILYTDMEAGHGGTTGRFKIYKDTAMEYAFLLMLEGINE